jgi:hypothetical protein
MVIRIGDVGFYDNVSRRVGMCAHGPDDCGIADHACVTACWTFMTHDGSRIDDPRGAAAATTGQERRRSQLASAAARDDDVDGKSRKFREIFTKPGRPC